VLRGNSAGGMVALQTVYASVHDLDTLQIPNDIKIYENYGHELQKKFNPLFRSNSTKSRWKEAAGFSAEFLFRTLFDKGL
jgi:hypothetical protein